MPGSETPQSAAMILQRAAIGAVLAAALCAGCVPMEPSGQPFAPVREPSPGALVRAPAAGAQRPPSGPQGTFDFEEDARTPDRPSPAPSAGASSAPVSDDRIELQARMLGVPPETIRRPPGAVPGGLAAGQPAPVWDPSVPLPQVSFGVRVLAVVLDVQPPRAMLALPDGREVVVQPGTMLPDAGLLVLAIGRDAVQVAKVTPQGFYASVQTETVQAMYTTAVPAPAAGAPAGD